MEIIKSKDNPLVKKVVSLVENKRERTKTNAFVIEGVRFCKEAVLSGVKVHTVLMTEEFISKHSADAEEFSKASDNVKVISDSIAKKISDTVNNQGVFFVCEMQKNIFEIKGSRFIALENLNDPGNIGTIIRTAEAFGIDGIVTIGNCADVYSPKVLRSTMGTIFRIPIHHFDSVLSAKNAFKNAGLTVYGAVLDDKSKHLSEAKLDKNSVCLIGNEANGLTQDAKNICDDFIIIDMPGNAESLNAAVAASVIMWEMIK